VPLWPLGAMGTRGFVGNKPDTMSLRRCSEICVGTGFGPPKSCQLPVKELRERGGGFLIGGAVGRWTLHQTV
jgi:hypothetical protein